MTTATSTIKLHEVRYYNTPAGDIAQVNFMSATNPNGANFYYEIFDNGNHWVESNWTWMCRWYPQVISDALKFEVDDGRWHVQH
jgi:hypothetical protein